MKPEYTNYFIIRKNTNNTEVLIDFDHTYNEVIVEEADKRGSLELYESVKSAKISSIVMNIDDAKSFRDILNKVLDE